jgi:hypothetical protein
MKRIFPGIVISLAFLFSGNQIQAQWITNGTSIYYNSGNIGIGTSSPPTNLSVAKGIDEVGLSSALQFVGPLNLGHSNDVGAGQALQYVILTPYFSSGTNPPAGLNGNFYFIRGNGGAYNANAEYHINIQSAYSSTNASVIPLGEYSPVAPLYIVTYNSKTYIALKMTDINGSGCAINFAGYWWNGYDGTQPQLLPATALSNITLYKSYQTILSNLVTGTSAGNVGIGTTTPAAKLDVAGAVNAGSLVIRNSGDNDLSTVQGGKAYHLIGTYSGWDPNTIYIGGYNQYNNSAASGVTKVYVGGPGSSVFLFDLGTGNLLINKTSQTNTAYRLDVAGSARADKLVVNTTGADYVFDSSYRLQSLDEVKSFIDQHHHLPGIEPARQMQDSGVDIGANQAKLLAKIEELTLYLLQQQKLLEQQSSDIIALKKTIQTLTAHEKKNSQVDHQ